MVPVQAKSSPREQEESSASCSYDYHHVEGVNETTTLVPALEQETASHPPSGRRLLGTAATIATLMVVVMAVTAFVSAIFSMQHDSREAQRVPSIVTTTTTTKHGEVWLIRHGEKDPIPLNGDKEARLRAMYDLSARGQDRARHLEALTATGAWPRFAAFYASRPATEAEALAAYPDFARDATGQSLIRREYQTLVPLAARQGGAGSAAEIRAQYAKGEVEEAARDIAETAVAAAAGRAANGSTVVLVSWDHCSLPTLVVKGFGCRSGGDGDTCRRCWPDDRFGDVLQLNVSLTTTTTITAKTAKDKGLAESETGNIAIPAGFSREYRLTSTILAMTGEAYPGDNYQYRPRTAPDDRRNATAMSSETATLPSAVAPTSIERSTPCAPSYCTGRPAAARLVRCACWDS